MRTRQLKLIEDFIRSPDFGFTKHEIWKMKRLINQDMHDNWRFYFCNGLDYEELAGILMKIVKAGYPDKEIFEDKLNSLEGID